MIITTEQRIEKWAEWSRSNSPIRALGYKSPSLALIRQKMGGGVPLPPISDDDAMFVDAAMVRLRERRGDLWFALALYYGVADHGACCNSYRAVAAKLGTNRIHAQQLVQQAVAWIDGQFDGVECVIESEAA